MGHCWVVEHNLCRESRLLMSINSFCRFSLSSSFERWSCGRVGIGRRLLCDRFEPHSSRSQYCRRERGQQWKPVRWPEPPQLRVARIVIVYPTLFCFSCNKWILDNVTEMVLMCLFVGPCNNNGSQSVTSKKHSISLICRLWKICLKGYACQQNKLYLVM